MIGIKVLAEAKKVAIKSIIIVAKMMGLERMNRIPSVMDSRLTPADFSAMDCGTSPIMNSANSTATNENALK